MQNQIQKAAIITLLLLIPFVPFNQALSQSKAPLLISELKIGDKIPEIIVPHLLGKHGQANVSDLYRPGLLIINFWASWCVPCIRELPKLEALKLKHPNEFNVLAVAYQDSSAVKSFLKKDQNIDISNLVITTNDTMLANYFPHKGIPHNVWINKYGIVKAITDEEEITEKNIQAFISNNELKMNVKEDVMSFNYNKPFHLGDTIFSYRSIITKYIDGIGGGYNLHGSHNYGITTFFGWNNSIVDLFYLLHTKYVDSYNTDYRIVEIHTKDSIKFFRPNQITNLPNRDQYQRRIDWEKEHTFCYELTLPHKVADTIFYQNVVGDLTRMFNVSYKIAYRTLPCDVVTILKDSKFKLEDYRGKPDTLGYAHFFKYQLVLKNATIDDLIHSVLTTWDPKEDLWINKTGVDFALNLTIDFDKNQPVDLALIKSKLLEYGIKIEMEPHKYPIMVLDDLAKN